MSCLPRSGWCWIGWLLLSFCWGFAPSAQAAKARFAHRVPSSVPEGKTIVLQGTIVGMDDLDYADFRFRRMNTNKKFRTIRLKQKGKKFFVRIPGRYVRAPGVEYYVIARDFNGRSRLLAGTPLLRQQILVIKDLDGSDNKNSNNNNGGSNDNSGNSGSGGYSFDNVDTGGNKPKVSKKKSAGETLSNKLTVFSASRRQQSIAGATSTVGLFTAQDIQHYGFRSLPQLLRFAPGFDLNRTGRYFDLGLRGLNPFGNQGRGILVLVDGHDMSWRQGQQQRLTASLVSVDDIDRIEMIRGPASAQWGGRASQGLIHIFTKSSEHLQGLAATLGVAPSSGTHFFTLRGGQSFKSGLRFYSSFSMHNEFRSPILAPLFEFANAPKDPLDYVLPREQTQNRTLYTKLAWRGLSMSFHYSQNDQQSSMHPDSGLGGDDTLLATERWFARLQYQRQLSKAFALKVWTSFDRQRFLPQSAVEFSPLQPQVGGQGTRGASETYRLQSRTTVNGQPQTKFVGYYPSCDALNNATSACVRVATVQAEGKATRACLIQPNKAAQVPQQVGTAGKYKSWFPMEDCQSIRTNGRYLRSLQGEDNRFRLGTLMTIKPNKAFTMLVGLELEYLQSVLQSYAYDWPAYNVELTRPEQANLRFGGFVQAQLSFAKYFLLHGAFRVDYDAFFGLALQPNLAVVFNMNNQWFARLHYNMSQNGPTLQEGFGIQNAQYGNPTLTPETIHNIGLQGGWWNKKLLYLGVSAYYATHQNVISLQNQKAGAVLKGEQFFPQQARPTGAFQQLTNLETGYTTLGFEVEGRLFPGNGFELKAHFGLALATRVNSDGDTERLLGGAGVQGGILATYKVRFFRISLGALYVGSKLVPEFAYAGGATLPAANLIGQNTSKPAPGWAGKDDPRGTPEIAPRVDGYLQLHLTLQFQQLFGHFDLVVQARNLQGLAGNSYDAGPAFLYPHTRTEFLLWLKMVF